jgi:hypothetical protein
MRGTVFGKWLAKRGGGVDLEFDELADAVQAIAEHEAGAVDRAEQVRDHREAAALHSREGERGSAGGVDAALNLGDFQAGVDLGIDSDELAMSLKI